MPKNPFSHVDFRVRDLKAAADFYRTFLPLIGFTKVREESEEWVGFICEGVDLPERAFFGIMPDPSHQPNGNRLAFWVETPAQVDEVGRALAATGAPKVEGPMLCPEYSEDYYAVFFEDPSGNLLEVVHRTK